MTKNSFVTVTRTRSNCGRYDYLVRNVAYRAILVILTSGMINIPKMTEFEIHWLAVFAAKAAKKKGWKAIVLDLRTYGVYARNSSKTEPFLLGQYNEIVEPEHFLNDNYLSPPGFWIQPSTNCKSKTE